MERKKMKVRLNENSLKRADENMKIICEKKRKQK